MNSVGPSVDLNPFSPANILDPVPFHRELSAHHPAYFSDAVQGWLITRYADVEKCLRDPRLSANRTHFFTYRFQEVGLDVVKDYIQLAHRQMVMLDGAEHLRLRRLSSPAFSSQALDALLPFIRHSMNQLLDEVQAQGRMDVVQRLSVELPPTVITECFGIPPADRARFRAWAKPLTDLASSGVPPEELPQLARRANQTVCEMNEYLGALIDARRDNPGSDMLSGLISLQAEGRMTTEEVVANASLIVTAGFITTTDQISNLVYDLLTHPEQWRLLRDNPQRVKSAVEEGLRYSPSINFMSRVAAETFSLHGQEIHKGQPVFLGLSAANRDPAVFPQPDAFDITRDFTQQKHLSFAVGSHLCLGAGLARRELEVALDTLLARMPGLRLDEAHAPKPKIEGILTRGFASLPVRW